MRSGQDPAATELVTAALVGRVIGVRGGCHCVVAPKKFSVLVTEALRSMSLVCRYVNRRVLTIPIDTDGNQS